MDSETERILRDFVAGSDFARRGAVITDLDGTALLEQAGRLRVAPEVEFGLKHLNDLGRPVAINTLRFPLNVVRTFGRAWTAITDAALPFISLNGAITGYLHLTRGAAVVFEELDAVPLGAAEIAEVLLGVQGLVEGGVTSLLLFHYPRDWTAGELIWTPDPARVDATRAKYVSASEVWSGPVAALRDRLAGREHCMIFLLVDAPGDTLMAYQHVRPRHFVTHVGVDKLAGAERLAAALGFALDHSIGAGDTPMDSFLRGCGLALQVGPMELEHKGRAATLKLPDPAALGGALGRIADLLRDGRP